MWLLSKRIVIYNRPYTAAIYSDYVPSKDEAQSPFVMAMAGNEYEPIQVGLYVPGDKTTLQDVSLQLECDIPSQTGRIHYSSVREQQWAGIDEKNGAPKQVGLAGRSKAAGRQARAHADVRDSQA